MKITILGGGPIGITYAALLINEGFEVEVYSKTYGKYIDNIRVNGAVNFYGKIPFTNNIGTALEHADILLCTRCAGGIQTLLEDILPHIKPHQTLIFSAELSLSSVYADIKLKRLGKHIPIISWSTTLATAQRLSPEHIISGTLRERVDYAVTNPHQDDTSEVLLTSLFGPRFYRLPNALSVALSNLNPPIHLANSLANLTRIEKGEQWDNYAGITPAVGRTIEALDCERIALAEHFDFKVRSVREHYLKTFPGIEPGTVSEMAMCVSKRGPVTLGPQSITTRYLTEDIPFGLVPLVWLGEQVGVAMPLHNAGIKMASAYTGRDFFSENTLLETITVAWQKPYLTIR